MGSYQWFLLVGCLMLARGLWGTPIARLPFTSAIIYPAIGTLPGPFYYLTHAIEHGLPQPLAQQLVNLTLAVIALSIVVHGTSVTPLLDRFRRK